MILPETNDIEPIFTPLEIIMYVFPVPVALIILARIIKYKERRKSI